MATPQYATAIIQGPGGSRKMYRVYCSDAAGSITWPDGASSITFPVGTALVDLIFAATLATTPTLTVNVGGLPITILNTATMTAATNQSEELPSELNWSSAATGTDTYPTGRGTEHSAVLS